jgi:hypothetical protein
MQALVHTRRQILSSWFASVHCPTKQENLAFSIDPVNAKTLQVGAESFVSNTTQIGGEIAQVYVQCA